MKHSQSIDLAIHALLFIARNDHDQAVMIRDIATRQNISESYLAKVLQSLAKTDMVRSIRGKKGGYYLGRPAGEITIGDVVKTLDQELANFQCGYESRDCPFGPSNCALPTVFDAARDKMYEVLDSVTLEDLSIQFESTPQPVKWIGKN